MSWGGAADWFAVAGTALLTFGTGVQARAALAEYKIRRRSISDATSDAVVDATSSLIDQASRNLRAWLADRNPGTRTGRRHRRWLPLPPDWVLTAMAYVRIVFSSIFYIPRNLLEIRTRNEDDVIELARFLRLTVVWGILTMGAALALAAASIQLALA